MGFPSVAGIALIFGLVGLAGWQFKHARELKTELEGRMFGIGEGEMGREKPGLDGRAFCCAQKLMAEASILR